MFYFRQKKLIEHIKQLNKNDKINFSEDVKHWQKLNIFDIGDFQNYLERLVVISEMENA